MCIAGICTIDTLNVSSSLHLPPPSGTEIPFVLSPPFSYGAELGTKVALSCGVRGEGITGVSWEAKSGRTFPTIVPGKPLILDNIDVEAGDEYRCVVHTQEGGRVVSQYARVAIYGEAMCSWGTCLWPVSQCPQGTLYRCTVSRASCIKLLSVCVCIDQRCLVGGMHALSITTCRICAMVNV